MSVLYWIFGVLTLVGIGINFGLVGKARQPLTAGAAWLIAFISGFEAFLLIYAALRL